MPSVLLGTAPVPAHRRTPAAMAAAFLVLVAAVGCLVPLAAALPINPGDSLGSYVVGYYRFTENPRRSPIIVDSSSAGKNATFPPNAIINSRTWAVGGDLNNRGLRLQPNSLAAEGIQFPSMLPGFGLAVQFLLEPANMNRTQTILYTKTSTFTPLLQLELDGGRLLLKSPFMFENRYSIRSLRAGALYHIVVSMKQNSISLYINGVVDLELSIWANWPDNSQAIAITIGKDPDVAGSQLEGIFDELMLFSRGVEGSEVATLFQTFWKGKTPLCTQNSRATDDFGYAGSNLDGAGSPSPCGWGSAWASRAGTVQDNKLVFDTDAPYVFGSRFLSVAPGVATANFSANLLDLCRVVDRSEPMTDLVGYCRLLGKTITINLCSFDGYCITAGIATDVKKFVYRLGYLSDPLNFAGTIPRPMVTDYPDGLFLRVVVSETLETTISFGSTLLGMTTLVTDQYLSNGLGLYHFDTLRLVVVSANNEPGARFDSLSVSHTLPPDGTIICDEGQYPSGGTCNSCPQRTTSPLGSPSIRSCVCQSGFTKDTCGGFPWCQDQGFSFAYPSFANSSGLIFAGSATLATGDIVQLTPSTPSKLGGFVYSQPIYLSTFDGTSFVDASFSSHFIFMINGNGGPLSWQDRDGPGADGLAFLMLGNLNPPSGPGAGLGFGGMQPSLAIEFDTYQNYEVGDVNGNHIGIDLNGNLRSVTQVPVTPRFNDGDLWHCWVDYDGEHSILEVRVAPSYQRPAEPTITLQENIPFLLSPMYVGFSAATGAEYSSHYLVAWDFTLIPRQECQACPWDHYKGDLGNQACTSCPPFSGTMSEASTSLDQCLCFPGFYKVPFTNGNLCQACPVDFYSPEYNSTCRPCPPNSHTYNSTGSSYCFCAPGFFPDGNGTCQDVNECVTEEIECLNGGYCHNEEGSHECICPIGWSGDRCERDINECNFVPCLNSGTCTNTPGSFVCNCRAGWTGTNCQEDINECEIPGTCSQFATCTNTPGSYLCACQEPYIGDGQACSPPSGPKLLPPPAGDIFGRYVVLTWEPEVGFDTTNLTLEIDVAPFALDFVADVVKSVPPKPGRFIVDGLPPLTEMRIRLIASNPRATSPPSNPVGFKTTAASPDPPQLSYSIVPGGVLFSWTPGKTNGAQVTGFQLQLYKKDSYNTTITENAGPSDTSLLVDDLLLNTVYYAVLTALSSDKGNSEPSNKLLVEVTKVIPPTEAPSEVPSATSGPGEDTKTNGGLIAGVVTGIFLLVVIVMVVVYYLKVRSKKEGVIRLADEDPAKRRPKNRDLRKKPKESDLSLLSPVAVVEEDINVTGGFDEDAEDIDDAK